MGNKKKIAKFFREEGKKLEPEVYVAFHKFSEIRYVNTAEEGQPEDVNPVMGYTMQHQVNHGRRLKRLYKKYGKKEVDKYFNQRGFTLVEREENRQTDKIQ